MLTGLAVSNYLPTIKVAYILSQHLIVNVFETIIT